MAVRKQAGPSDSAGDPDSADAALASAGNVAAFERLYRRHVNRVNSLAEWMLGSSDTEDVLQDIFIRAWERLVTFRGESAFGTWLHRLAVNVLLRYRQQSRLRQERFVSDEDSVRSARARRDGLHLRTEIESAVAALPQRMRDVLVLHDVEGYKHREIASKLGISAGTSQWHLHAARMKLREHFE
jgi:RNA polymerase sigma-70 factor (ECF subfamily)